MRAANRTPEQGPGNILQQPFLLKK